MIKSDEVMRDIEANQIELEATETIGKIFLIKEKIEEKPVNEWNMNSLVDHVFTLCKIMDNLSDLKDYAYARAESLGEEYKACVRDKYLGLKNSGRKMTDTMAKSLAEQHCDDIKAEELAASHKARRLKSLYQDCERLISYTQTKIKSQTDSFIRSNIER